MSRHTLNLLYGNNRSFVPNIFYKYLKKMWIVHIHKSPEFKLGDQGSHSPQSVTCSLKTSFSSTTKLFPGCAVSFHCIKCLYDFSSLVSSL